MPGGEACRPGVSGRVRADRRGWCRLRRGLLFQVAVHGRGELGVLDGDLLAQESGDGLRERESAGGPHGCALVESLEYGLLSVGDCVDFAYGAVEQTGDKAEEAIMTHFCHMA